jgi:hypothetical protein
MADTFADLRGSPRLDQRGPHPGHPLPRSYRWSGEVIARLRDRNHRCDVGEGAAGLPGRYKIKGLSFRRKLAETRFSSPGGRKAVGTAYGRRLRVGRLTVVAARLSSPTGFCDA